MKKYDWIPTECAPSDYPAQIYNGFVYYGDGKKIYIPDGRSIDYGWGKMGSVNIAGEEFKEAPNRITVNWISYAENKSYSGDFQLDEKKIDSLLAAGYRDDSEKAERPTYHYLKVGLAPGGFVVIWLTGSNSQVEVGHFKAKEIAGFDWQKLYPEIDMQEHRKIILDSLSDNAQKEIAKGNIPFDYWAKLRPRYNWKFDFSTVQNLLISRYECINKEEFQIYADEVAKNDFRQLAPPEHIYVEWLDGLKRRLGSEIWLDVAEMQTLFNQYGSQKITVKVSVSENSKEAKLTLNVNDKVLATPKIKTKTFYKSN